MKQTIFAVFSKVCLDPPGTCKHSICQCDKRLAESVWSLLDTDYVRKYSTKEDPTRHSFEENCRIVKSTRSIEIRGQHDMCCGNYPNRFPFDSDSGTKSCCGGKTYSLEYGQCCSGSLKGIDEQC